MHRNLHADLAHIATLAFRRSAHCAPLLEKFHALKNQIAAIGHPDLLWNIYDWLLVPLSLWPLDFEGLSHFLFTTLTHTPTLTPTPQARIQNRKSKIENADSPQLTDSLIHLLKLIPPPPAAETIATVAEFERFVESGRYEKMLKQSQKFDEQEKALLQNEELLSEWAEIKRLF